MLIELKVYKPIKELLINNHPLITLKSINICWEESPMKVLLFYIYFTYLQIVINQGLKIKLLKTCKLNLMKQEKKLSM